MKAKEYADRIMLALGSHEEFVNAVADVLSEMINGVGALAKQRGVKTVSGVQGCYRQQRQQWEAVCRLVSGLRPEMFDELFAKHTRPALVEMVQMGPGMTARVDAACRRRLESKKQSDGSCR
ncbi:MAG: hypothetical protein ABIH36_04395 [bacterium]